MNWFVRKSRNMMIYSLNRQEGRSLFTIYNPVTRICSNVYIVLSHEVVCQRIAGFWHTIRVLLYMSITNHSTVRRVQANHGDGRFTVWILVTDTGSADGLSRGDRNGNAPLPGMHGHFRRDDPRRRTPSLTRCLRIWAHCHDLYSGRCVNVRTVNKSVHSRMSVTVSTVATLGTRRDISWWWGLRRSFLPPATGRKVL